MSFLRFLFPSDECGCLIIFHYWKSSLLHLVWYFSRGSQRVPFEWISGKFSNLKCLAVSHKFRYQKFATWAKIFFAHQMICKQNRNKHKRLIFLSLTFCVPHTNIEIHFFSYSCHYWCDFFFLIIKKKGRKKKYFASSSMMTNAWVLNEREQEKCIPSLRQQSVVGNFHLWHNTYTCLTFLHHHPKYWFKFFNINHL